jgi:hypothetical protein
LNSFVRKDVRVVRVLDKSLFFQLVDKVVETQGTIEETVLLCELLQPAQRFINIPARLDQKVAEDGHEGLQPLLVRHRSGGPFAVKKTHEESLGF